MYSYFQPLPVLYFLLRPLLRKNNPILCTPFVYLSFESIPLPVLGACAGRLSQWLTAAANSRWPPQSSSPSASPLSAIR